MLQDRTFEVLGSSKTRTVDVRVISATNRTLSDLVARGEFREDLLYRINLIALHLPPLRERPGDIPVLASHFARAAAQAYGRDDFGLAAGARGLAEAPAVARQRPPAPAGHRAGGPCRDARRPLGHRFRGGLEWSPTTLRATRCRPSAA